MVIRGPRSCADRKQTPTPCIFSCDELADRPIFAKAGDAYDRGSADVADPKAYSKFHSGTAPPGAGAVPLCHPSIPAGLVGSEPVGVPTAV